MEEFITLKDIDLQIRKGEFVCVVGDVGSGKSSLFNAINGDMIYIPTEDLPTDLSLKRDSDYFAKLTSKLLKGTLSDIPIGVQGSISYVEQQAWIQNMTIRENILFGQSYNQEKYQEVIKCCQLARDLEILPAGDLTEIGERGINLSGG